MVYNWKEGARFSVDPQAVGEELEKIAVKDAASVVKAAKKSTGALHKCFEWDDTKAAQAHRMEQARLVLRMIVVDAEKTVGGKSETIRIRAFESVRFASVDDDADKSMVYVPIKEVLSDPLLREQVIGRIESTIEDAKKTAEDYAYLVPRLKLTAQKLKEARATVR